MSRRKSLNRPEPKPKRRRNGQAIWDLVIADMHERDKIGAKKYGTRLRAFDGRESLVDLYQELLDAVVYLRKELRERCGP